MLEVLARAFGLLVGYGAIQLLLRVIDHVEWPEAEPAAAA